MSLLKLRRFRSHTSNYPWTWIAQSVWRLVTSWTVSRDRIPEGERFSAPVQTGLKAHAASYIMDTGYFPEVQRPGCDVETPPHLALRLKKEYNCTSTPPPGPSWPVLGLKLPLPLPPRIIMVRLDVAGVFYEWYQNQLRRGVKEILVS
jgi:hypothetical protein